MNDYISREDVLADIYATHSCGGFKRECDYLWLHNQVINAITADLQPVRHGRWIIEDDVEHFIAVCSECGRAEDSRAIKDMPYCHCGARMDGDVE